jgi:hypothetical protein
MEKEECAQKGFDRATLLEMSGLCVYQDLKITSGLPVIRAPARDASHCWCEAVTSTSAWLRIRADTACRLAQDNEVKKT